MLVGIFFSNGRILFQPTERFRPGALGLWELGSLIAPQGRGLLGASWRGGKWRELKIWLTLIGLQVMMNALG